MGGYDRQPYLIWTHRGAAIGLPAGLAAMGVTEAVLPRIAAEAAASFFNASSARKGTADDYLALLHKAMQPA